MCMKWTHASSEHVFQFIPSDICCRGYIHLLRWCARAVSGMSLFACSFHTVFSMIGHHYISFLSLEAHARTDYSSRCTGLRPCTRATITITTIIISIITRFELGSNPSSNI